MKEQVLKREMFTKPMSKASKNSGIMAGFEDMEPEEDEMPPMARSPQNPEILMNNLRGDFRSVDARYAELAQMVGEEAASETPPEVLAMLQQQFAAPVAPPQPPQGGIGALPQGAGMAPPPEMMGSMAPPMPPGMEGAPPFPQGGAGNAPPTPDGLPPERFVTGGPASAAGRAARYVADSIMSIPKYLSEGVRGIPDDVRNMATSADKYFSQFLPPTFVDEPMKGLDNKQIYLQGREVIKRNPDGTFVMGEGTRITPGTSMSVGREPVSKYFRDTFAQNPRMSKAAGIAGGVGLGGAGIYEQITNRASPPPPRDPNYVSMVDQIPIPDKGKVVLSDKEQELMRSQERDNFPPIPTEKATADTTAADTTTADKSPITVTDAFIRKQLAEPTKTRAQRIAEEYKAVEPTFRELLGDTKNDMRTNALLLLADAGFKLAGTKRANFAMALSESLSGMPKGFAALIAQARDMNIKIKSAALEQASNSITQQDKLANDIQIAVIKGDNKRKEILLQSDMDIRKLNLTENAPVYTNGAVGLTRVKTKRGDDLGAYISVNPETNQLAPEIQSMIDSPNTIRPVSPYVKDYGKPKTSMALDDATRTKLRDEIFYYDDALSTIDNMQATYLNAANKFGIKGWYSDVKNNLLVPIAPIEPNIIDQKAITSINSARNQLQARLAKLNGYGSQVAVKELQMLDKILPDPAGTLFSDIEVNLANLNSLKTQMINDRQQRLVRLGASNRDYVMEPPAMGTKNDPFVVSANPEENAAMETFLRSSIGQYYPGAVIHLRMPDGSIRTTTPSALKGQ